MKKFKFNINGNQYEAEVIAMDDNVAEVEINGSRYVVHLESSVPVTKTPKLMRSVSVPSTDVHPSVAKTSSPASPKGAGSIKSPLPGVILEVFVKEGERVKIGQKLLVLEAMKMENTIEADKEGVVAYITRHKGDAVMEGDVLIVIED